MPDERNYISLKSTSEFQRMWSDPIYTLSDIYENFELDYVNLEMVDVEQAYNELTMEMKELFLRIKYGE